MLLAVIKLLFLPTSLDRRPLPKQDPPHRIWQILCLEEQTWRSLRLTIRELEVVVLQKMNHDRLDLCGSKKATRARMAAVSKGHAGRVRSGIQDRWLILFFIGAALFLFLGELLEAEPFEDGRFGIELGVHGDGVRGDADCRVCWDDDTVGERIVFGDESLECNFQVSLAEA